MPTVFVPAVNCCEVELTFLVEGQIVENVYHVAMGAAPTEANMNTVAGIFKSWWVASLTAMEPTTVALDNVRVTDQTTQTGRVVEYVTGLPVSGANGVGNAPLNVTLAIKWLTGNRGRSFRGRTYHVQLRTDQYTGSHLSGTNQADLKTNYAALLAALDAEGFKLSVLSRWENKVPRITGVVTFITGLSVDPIIDSQRRRLPGRGR